MRKVGHSFSKKFSKSEIKQSVASPTSGSVTTTKVFGVKLDLTQTELPRVLKMAIDYFDVKGYEYEGLFRLSGNMNTIQDIIAKVEASESFDILTVSDPHVVAGLLKQYLLLLPEPILTYELHDVFLAATMVAKQKGQLDPLKRALSFLAPQSLRVLKALVGLLSRTSAFSEKNKMSPVNLAIAFSPCLVRSESEGGLEATMKEMTRSNSLLELLIVHYNHFFDVPVANGEVGLVKEPSSPQCQALIPSPPSTAPVVSKGDVALLPGHHLLRVEPSLWKRDKPLESADGSSGGRTSVAYKTLEEALTVFFELARAARNDGNLSPTVLSDRFLTSAQMRLVAALPSFQRTILRSSQTTNPTSVVFPHSFFINSKGKIGLLFSGWPQSVLSFKNAIDENDSSIPRSVRCPKVILAYTKPNNISKEEIAKIATICKEANQKLLTRLQKAVPYSITRVALALHQRRDHTLPAVLKLSDEMPSTDNEQLSSQTPTPSTSFAKSFVDMKSALYQATDTVNPEQKDWKISLVQFSENQTLCELFSDFKKFVFEKQGQQANITWIPEDSTALILHSLTHGSRSPLQGFFSSAEYGATGMSSLSSEQQSHLVAWISRVVSEAHNG
eukprot:TRINITY_DN3600_c0_g4_i2.p1 TRINITY_DN3600_c0_g4~~TRINITY_DN3600_c0_g4_i2.p1  ORF type:complete len:616 (+),score=107.87 TRINITY_DN3600_c0_g4_i2:123-1970(+)